MISACINQLQTQPPWLLLISFIGLLNLLNSSLSLLLFLHATFLRPPKNLKTHYGSWALVTGATDGIGRAFADQLAQQGLNLILLGRNPHKLRSVARHIHATLPETKIKILVFDFSQVDRFGDVEDVVRGLDVGVLINNVGVTYPAARFFHEVEEDVWGNVVRVNLEGTTWVTRKVLPGMLRRRRGAIVNIGSGAAIVVPSHPLYAVYAATKAYIDRLSKCLEVEYKKYGIDVQCQVPLYVATRMTRKVAGIERASTFIPTAEEYVRAAMRRIGYEARCTPYFLHSLQWSFCRFLPHSLLDAWRLSIGIHRRQSSLRYIHL